MKTHDDVIKTLMCRPGVKAEVERIERHEGELLDALLKARHEAGLTQADLVVRMGTSFRGGPPGAFAGHGQAFAFSRHLAQARCRVRQAP